MKLESRYIVLKRKDVEQQLDPEQKVQLEHICNRLEIYREAAMKKPVDGIYIDRSWPEYQAVFNLLEDRVDRQEFARGLCEHANDLGW